MSKKIVIIGGHGNVGLQLSRSLAKSSPAHIVKSVIRNPNQSEDILNTSAEPVVLSLEDDPVSKFIELFEGQDIVYFSAAAGVNAGDERTRRVDFEGAVKVFNAIEAVKGIKPRLITVSASDVRNPEKVPAHYTEEDIETSKLNWERFPWSMKWKYEADKNLISRNTFKWTITRPGYLSAAEPQTGKASIGRTRLGGLLSLEDFATVLILLLDREDAAGLALDVVAGETPISEGLNAAIKRGETDFLG